MGKREIFINIFPVSWTCMHCNVCCTYKANGFIISCDAHSKIWIWDNQSVVGLINTRKHQTRTELIWDPLISWLLRYWVYSRYEVYNKDHRHYRLALRSGFVSTEWWLLFYSWHSWSLPAWTKTEKSEWGRRRKTGGDIVTSLLLGLIRGLFCPFIL